MFCAEIATYELNKYLDENFPKVTYNWDKKQILSIIGKDTEYYWVENSYILRILILYEKKTFVDKRDGKNRIASGWIGSYVDRYFMYFLPKFSYEECKNRIYDTYTYDTVNKWNLNLKTEIFPDEDIIKRIRKHILIETIKDYKTYN